MGEIEETRLTYLEVIVGIISAVIGTQRTISLHRFVENAWKTYQLRDMGRGRCIEDRPAGLYNCERD